MKFSACIFSLLCIANVANAAEILIHTGDPGTSSTGQWYSATGASMPIDGNRGLYTSVGGPVETYTFITTVPETTEYTLQVYNTCYTPRSHQVTQSLTFSGGTETFVTDQDCQTDPFVGQWRTLGTFDFQQNESVEFFLTSENSNNSYVGVSAIRYVYNTGTPPQNNEPTLELSTTSIQIQANSVLNLSAVASDVEDGDLSDQIQWSSPILSTTGSNFNATVGTENFVIEVSVQDNEGLTANASIDVEILSASAQNQIFDFGCTLGPLHPTTGLTSYNAQALENVGSMCNRYTAQVSNNTDNRTLFYHQDQGRLDGVVVRFPFEAILRNVGIAPVDQPHVAHAPGSFAYNFVGLHVHHIDFNNINSAHMVVGQRGSAANTIEGKHTRDGVSSVNDAGNNILPEGRADLRIHMDENGQIRAYWQLPNTTGNPANDEWTLYRGTGEFPGATPEWGSGNQVIVGIITYAFHSTGLPFWGVADSFEIIEL